MRIYSRHFVARFLGLFGAILVGSILAIAAIETLLNLDDMLRSGSGLAGALRYLFLRIPSYYWKAIVPVAVFAAAFLCLGLAAQRSEILAMKSGGLGLLRSAGPVLAAAVGVALAAGFVDESWGVASQRASLLEASRDVEFVRGGRWIEHGGRIYHLGRVDPERNLVHGIEIFERGPSGRLLRRVRAARAIPLEGSRFRLEEVTRITISPENPFSPPRVDSPATLEIDLGPRAVDALLASTPAALSLADLFLALSHPPNEQPDYRLRAELHLRLAQPATIVLLALLGAGFGLRVGDGRSLGRAALEGITVLAFFYGLRAALEILVVAGALPAASLWLGLGAATAAALSVLLRVRR